jgi:hypothetical protein
MLTVVMAGSSIGVARAGTPPLTVALTLEDSTFLVGQSIYLIARLRNNGAPSDRGVPHTLGYFRIKLYSKATGQLMRDVLPAGSRDGFGFPLTILPPGEVRCALFDILLHYGQDPPRSSFLPRLLRSTWLPAADYILYWDYVPDRAHPWRPPVLFRGEIPFSIRPLSTDLQEQALVSEFLSAAPTVGSTNQHCRAWLPRFYGSKFLILIYMSTGQLLDALDFDDIVRQVTAAGAPAERRAALLALRLSMIDHAGRFTPEWRARLAQTLESPIERDVLAMPRRVP